MGAPRPHPTLQTKGESKLGSRNALTLLKRAVVIIAVLDLILAINDSRNVGRFFLLLTMSSTFTITPENVIRDHCHHNVEGICETYSRIVGSRSTSSVPYTAGSSSSYINGGNNKDDKFDNLDKPDKDSQYLKASLSLQRLPEMFNELVLSWKSTFDPSRPQPNMANISFYFDDEELPRIQEELSRLKLQNRDATSHQTTAKPLSTRGEKSAPDSQPLLIQTQLIPDQEYRGDRASVGVNSVSYRSSPEKEGQPTISLNINQKHIETNLNSDSDSEGIKKSTNIDPNSTSMSINSPVSINSGVSGPISPISIKKRETDVVRSQTGQTVIDSDTAVTPTPTPTPILKSNPLPKVSSVGRDGVFRDRDNYKGTVAANSGTKTTPRESKKEDEFKKSANSDNSYNSEASTTTTTTGIVPEPGKLQLPETITPVPVPQNVPKTPNFVSKPNFGKTGISQNFKVSEYKDPKLLQKGKELVTFLEEELFSRWPLLVENAQTLLQSEGNFVHRTKNMSIVEQLDEPEGKRIRMHIELRPFGPNAFCESSKRIRATQQILFDYPWLTMVQLYGQLSGTFTKMFVVISIYTWIWGSVIALMLLVGSLTEDQSTLHNWIIFNILYSLLLFMIDDWIHSNISPARSPSSLWLFILYSLYKPLATWIVLTQWSEIKKLVSFDTGSINTLDTLDTLDTIDTLDSIDSTDTVDTVNTLGRKNLNPKDNTIVDILGDSSRKESNTTEALMLAVSRLALGRLQLKMQTQNEEYDEDEETDEDDSESDSEDEGKDLEKGDD